MLQLPSVAILIPAVVVIAFNLMQDGVNSGSGRICLVLLNDLMGGIPLAGHGEVDRMEKILLHNES